MFLIRPFCETYLLPCLLFCLLVPACNSPEMEISIRDVWISEAPPMAKVNGGYFSVKNLSQKPIDLVQVSSHDFGRIEMHRSIVEQDIARMEKQETVTIPAETELLFRPGDFHLMLFEAIKPLKSGDTTSLIFYFSDKSIIEITANVRPLGAQTEHNHTM